MWSWTEQERKITVQRIKDGIEASSKRSGRATGKLDKMSDELKADIQLFIKDRSIKQIDLMQKHNISRNTLKKYIEIVKNGNRNSIATPCRAGKPLFSMVRSYFSKEKYGRTTDCFCLWFFYETDYDILISSLKRMEELSNARNFIILRNTSYNVL